MMASRLVPERAMTCACRLARSGSSVAARSSAMTMMPFIGVRISWLIVARKADFAWLAWSAACAACK